MKKNYRIENVIHIGANKTATTSFQDYLFSKTKHIGYIGNKRIQTKKIQTELKNLRMQDDFSYDSSYLKKKIKQIKKKKINVFLYSDEDILTSNNLSRCSRRLKSLLPSAKIVLIIRNQISALESWYFSHGKFLKMVPKKYFGKHVSFNDWLSYCFEFKQDFVTPLQSSPIKAMDYYEIASIFSKNFGLKNINILIYEDLLYKKNETFIKWSKLLGINKGDIKLKISKKKFLRKSIKKNIKINQRNLKNIKMNFAKSNKLLANKFNLNLQTYNYPL